MPTNTTVETSPDTATSRQAQQGVRPPQAKQPASTDPGVVTEDGSNPIDNEPPFNH